MSTEMPEKPVRKQAKDEEPELPSPWRRVQAAIWLLGLAVIAWQDWWWPGILVLIALSGLAQGLLGWYFSQKKEEAARQDEAAQIEQQRAAWLPSVCPNCGGPISVATVRWTGDHTADCPYCSANLKRP
jgi:hypothetical protein